MTTSIRLESTERRNQARQRERDDQGEDRMTLTQRLARATLALAIAGFCASSPAVAQDWKAVWQKTVDAANAEGTLLFYSQPNQAARDFILREFPKAYPNI